MNDPRDPRSSRPPEPPESRRSDAPDVEAGDRRELEELRSVVSLLRGLPDPEPPESLIPRVMERVAAREARPRVVRAAFRAGRALAEPRTGLALAAGVACLLAVASFRNVSPFDAAGSDPAAPTRNAQQGPAQVGSGTVADAAVPRVRRPAPARGPSATVVHPQFVSFLNSYPQAPTPRVRLGQLTSPGLERADRHFDDHLDTQLNRLLLDPKAFVEQLERVARRDAVIARLADRAARRGDATQIALKVRQVDHPLGQRLVNRLLRASLVERVSPR